ncbi:unnamed protein product [Kuraishia capsulata CBS 1993]|uniref:Folic acid synthesis protein FOL1 n=1 Tax=Kuraishia capsulata CBS 1993 TaxID=1382522 RepID=W6MP58_9ASCO|nr:uncharacterized protein KUCA_T00002841001 [Kuraishia capsulata CBS 1993]CDK26867.1 unnamed protein product [Kuraishia capsulata CBS 1993]
MASGAFRGFFPLSATLKPTERLSTVYLSPTIPIHALRSAMGSTRNLGVLAAKKDTVFVDGLKIDAITGRDFWNRPVPQPLAVSLTLGADLKEAAATDDLRYSLNYAVVSSKVLDHFRSHSNVNFGSIERIAEEAVRLALDACGTDVARVGVESEKSEIRCRAMEVELERSLSDGKLTSVSPDVVSVHDLQLLTVIGVFTFERYQRQIVRISLKMEYGAPLTSIKARYFDAVKQVVDYVENSNFKTVEALVSNVASLVMTVDPNVDACTAEVTKPNAILASDGVGVSVTRLRSEIAPVREIDTANKTSETGAHAFSIPNLNKSTTFDESSDAIHIAYLAFGSNQGNQVKNIQQALQALEKRGVEVLNSSTLYVSKPMYYLDQPDFVNGAVKVKTTLSPHELLRTVKAIEYEDMGRVKKIENGPRAIDLDILLYDGTIVDDPDLKIPHIGIVDRSFVLAPLCELVGPDEIHPVTAEPFHDHLAQILKKEVDRSVQTSSDLLNVVPIPRLVEKYDGSGKGSLQGLRFDTFGNSGKTKVMGILNVTPDSFSDGGSNDSAEKVLAKVQEMFLAGVEIIDIGGCSTRPGSDQPSEKEELDRVIPAVKLIRSEAKYDGILISVDTYRSQVAKQSLAEGADIINDVSGGLFDEQMYSVVAAAGAPYIVGHLRGDIATMAKLNQYGDLVQETCDELAILVDRAITAGIRRWQLMIDPGLGFSKASTQNLEIIRRTPEMKKYGSTIEDRFVSFARLPFLLGPSRKKFIGELTDVSVAKDRVVGSVAAVMACISYGSDMVRVHDFKETKEACAVGDAIYRG